MVVDLSALGLASNIIQLVDFARVLVLDARSLRDSARGLSHHNNDLETVTKDLRQLSSSIKYQATSTASQGQEDETQLYRLAESSWTIADKLLGDLSKLKFQFGPHAKWRSVQQAFKATLKKDQIKNLQDRLDMLRQEITVRAVLITKYASRI